MTVERARGDENDKAGYSRQTLIRNRRLRYIQLNPALLKRLESGQSITADHDTPGERIGGPISANLIDAYDLSQRLSSTHRTTSSPHASGERASSSQEQQYTYEEGAEQAGDRDGEEQQGEEEFEEFDSDSDDFDEATDAIEMFITGVPGYDYTSIDKDESLDDGVDRDLQDSFFTDQAETRAAGDDDGDDLADNESRSEVKDEQRTLTGQTGVQDF